MLNKNGSVLELFWNVRYLHYVITLICSNGCFWRTVYLFSQNPTNYESNYAEMKFGLDWRREKINLQVENLFEQTDDLMF